MLDTFGPPAEDVIVGVGTLGPTVTHRYYSRYLGLIVPTVGGT